MPNVPTRRRFLALTPFGGLALLAACSPPAPPPVPPAPAPSPAPAPPAAASAAGETAAMVDESGSQATSLGYVADAARVDRQRFPTHQPGSTCGGCALYQGQAGAATGPCPIFGSQHVAAGGWCVTWTKKA